MKDTDNSKPELNIVLFAPEIPQNTGNIGRMCVNSNSRLHLIKPLGFSLHEKQIKRAGLDYWQHLDMAVYEDWPTFLDQVSPAERMFMISRFGKQSIYSVSYQKGDFLIFGNEGNGLPEDFYERYEDILFKIPMLSDNARSLNLANAAAITAFEALRQTHRW